MFKSTPLILVLLALGILLPRLAPSAVADTGPLFNPATGHWYQAVAAPNLQWEDARDIAASRAYRGLRGYLATMTSAEENAWVAANLPEALRDQHFLGAFQPDGSTEPDGGWRWVTPEPWRYTNWNTGQPDNSPNEYMVTFLGNGRWNDLRGTRGGYVIEYGLTPPPVRQIAFAPPARYDVVAPSALDSADFDSDGHLDLAVSSVGDVAIQYGVGDGTFGAPTFQALGSPAGQTLAVDVNRDGRLDLVVAGGTSVTVALSTGGRTYALPVQYLLGLNTRSVYSGDFNEDGFPDLAAVASGDHQFGVLLNQGDGAFAQPVYYSSGGFPGFIVGGDWNRDGHVDLAVTNTGDDLIALFRGDGKGGFRSQGGVSSRGTGPLKLIAGDFNNDGIADLVVGNTTGNTVTLLPGNGTGGFPTGIAYPAMNAPGAFSAVDLDGDGALDLTVPNDGSDYFTGLRNSSGAFGLPFIFSTGGSGANSLTSGDFNRDGRPDIAIASQGANRITIHLNETTPAAPAIPRSLVATALSSTQIQLTWTDASLNETGFQLDRKIGTGAFTRVTTTGPNVTTYQDTRVLANTQYTYRLRAFNSLGNSAYSNEAHATTPTSIPTPPTGLTATALSPRSVKLTWTDTSNIETGFEIERRGATTAFTRIRAVGPNIIAYTDPGVQPETQYFFRLRATGPGGNSGYTGEVAVETPPPPPTAPTTLAARIIAGLALLTWRDTSNNEAEFQVERRQGTDPFLRIGTINPNFTAFADSNITPGVAYSYRVRAANRGGASAYSNTATITRLPNLATFVVQPAAVKGGKPANGTVTLDIPAPAGGIVVTLRSNSPLAQLPATITFAAGAATAKVPITTRKTKKTKTAQLTATYNGGTLTASLKVKK